MTDSKTEELYLSEYSDTVEALPLELRRNYALIRLLDQSAEDIMTQVSTESTALTKENMSALTIEERRVKLEHIGHLLNEVLKKREETFALAKSTYDTVDRHCTRLDNDLQKIEDEQLIGPARSNATHTTHHSNEKRKTNPDATTITIKPSTGRGRKKSRKENDTLTEDTYISKEDAIQNAKTAATMSDLPIDPNEPKYCYCKQVSFGEMVACDNDSCEIEWFHLECVGLTKSPKGKWYCRNCTVEPKKKRRL